MATESVNIATADNVSVKRWLAIFAAYLLVMALPAAYLLGQLGQPWQELFRNPGQFELPWQQLLKLMVFAIYLSVCSTFLPLPTGWIVAAIATREVALAPTMGATVMLVAAAGALGSMMANLNDYHLVTLMLRSRRIAAVRENPLVRVGAGWFAKAPFTLILIFNIIPIPVDVARMMAATTRYPLRLFAAANFIGRFIRYAVLASVAYALDITTMTAIAAMLGVAVLVAVTRLALSMVKRMIRRDD